MKKLCLSLEKCLLKAAKCYEIYSQWDFDLKLFGVDLFLCLDVFNNLKCFR